METLSSFDKLHKKELIKRCQSLHGLLEKQKLTTTDWIEALALVVQTDQDVTKSLIKLLRLVLEAFQMDSGYIHLFDREERSLKLGACLGLPEREQEDLKILRKGEKVPGQILERAEVLLARNIIQISDLSGKFTREQNGILHAGFPLKWNGSILGTLTLVSKNHRTLAETDVAALAAFSQFIAVVVQNSTLFHIVSQSKRQWEDAFDSISDLVVVCDRNFRIVKTNRAILDRFWVPVEDAIGADCFRLLYNGNPLPVSRENLEEMLRQGVAFCEEIYNSPSDRVFSVAVSPILTSRGLSGSIHVIREVTQERLLEKDREQLAHKVSLFAPGTMTTDEKGIIRSWDSGAKKILGYEEEEIIGKPFSMIFSSVEAEPLFERLAGNQEILDLDTTAFVKGGCPIPVGLTLSAHRNLAGKLEEVTLFIRDMTRRGEDRLRRCQPSGLSEMIEKAAVLTRELWLKLETMTTHNNWTKDIPEAHTVISDLKGLATRARAIRQVLDRLQKVSVSNSHAEI
jgi:PAS domain S-box-containing protein